MFQNQSKDCSEEDQDYQAEEYPSFLSYSIHVYEESPKKYKGSKNKLADGNIFPTSDISNFIHSTHVWLVPAQEHNKLITFNNFLFPDNKLYVMAE